MFKPHWSEFEYDKLKLLLHQKKVKSIFDVIQKKKQFDNTLPISVEIHLTDLCNLECTWCTDKEIRKKDSTLDKEIVFKLFDFFSQNNIGVTLEGGGEPTIHPDFKEIMSYGYDRGLSMGLISNGVENISDLVNKFCWIRISIDATSSVEFKQEKGADKFEQIISNLKVINEERKLGYTQIGVGYVLTTGNMRNFIDLARRLEEIGIDYIYARPVEETPELKPDVQELLKLKTNLKEFEKTNRLRTLLKIQERMITANNNLPCVAHSLSCVIRADGNVSLCEKRRHDPIIFGNLNEEPFSIIWNSEIRRRASEKLMKKESQHGCSVCRMSTFNNLFYNLSGIQTFQFI